MFSICIPNFNYERYLGITLESVLAQEFRDFEVLVSDNASTDGSVEVVRGYQARDPRIQLRINRCNVGFAGNLAKAAAMASARYMIMLSSDDLMNADALQAYQRLFAHLGDAAATSIVSSATTIVDSDGQPTGEQRIDWKQWKGAQQDAELSALLDAPVYVMDAAQLLRNSLSTMRVPFYFLSTCYPKGLHDAVESYSQGGLFNPDKRFAWALLGQAGKAYFVDRPLFRYRVHNNNQAALQANSGALKHLVDEYIATFSVENALLARAGLSREGLAAAFIEHDIALRGFKNLAEGNRTLVRRMLAFGDGCYPQLMSANRKIRVLRVAVAAGPAGTVTARLAMERVQKAWEKRMAAENAEGSK
ncbi:glycosyltransferase [Solimonas sp. K1W22B-7]|uniref:glycosyltransferase n=1 Tax=Solimonas sp. K1W22B-7 TaxID=2303331 RepID=UPI000E333528|nr:glycosyltransferase [Solimonas sp. K1W22B-7]AXQ29914.1 glycosyltransferase [Solimonas sp. K1W22B-7]